MKILFSYYSNVSVFSSAFIRVYFHQLRIFEMAENTDYRKIVRFPRLNYIKYLKTMSYQVYSDFCKTIRTYLVNMEYIVRSIAWVNMLKRWWSLFLCFNIIVASKHGIASIECYFADTSCKLFWDFTAKVSLSWYVFLELRFSQTKTKKKRKKFMIGIYAQLSYLQLDN